MEKMLLIDFNNLAIRNLFTREIEATSDNPNFDLWEFMIFEQIYDYSFKFKNVTEIVLAVDHKQSWRKKIYPPYKENRKKTRDKDEVDWQTVYARMRQFIDELKKNIPFKILTTEFCEGDDIIAVLVNEIPEKKKVILTTDSDYKQLIDGERVKVYDPLKGKFMECDDCQEFLLYSILKGQAKDNIYNVKVPDNWPSQLRKPPLGDKTVEKILDKGLDSFLDTPITHKKKYTDDEGIDQELNETVTPRERYKINQKLIDLSQIPDTLTKRVMIDYNEYIRADIGRVYTFFERKGWRRFIEDIHNVEMKLQQLL